MGCCCWTALTSGILDVVCACMYVCVCIVFFFFFKCQRRCWCERIEVRDSCIQGHTEQSISSWGKKRVKRTHKKTQRQQRPRERQHPTSYTRPAGHQHLGPRFNLGTPMARSDPSSAIRGPTLPPTLTQRLMTSFLLHLAVDKCLGRVRSFSTFSWLVRRPAKKRRNRGQGVESKGKSEWLWSSYFPTASGQWTRLQKACSWSCSHVAPRWVGWCMVPYIRFCWADSRTRNVFTPTCTAPL